jgi:phosphoglycolate phosphatase
MTLICFDLDGTLVDPIEGAYESLRATCAGLGLPVPVRDHFAAQIGLDPAGLFPGLSGPGLQEALARYRRLFSEEGFYTQRILDGVHLLLTRLKRQGHRLLLVTDQPAGCARRTLHQFDLLLHFDDVVGLLPLEAWKSKGELLERSRRDGGLQAGGYLIGDRADDMQAAKIHGLKAVGVSYGYGSPQELRDAQAEVILDSVPALDAWLEKELNDPEIHDPFSRSE